jgi:hypothetical protein
MFNRVEGRHKTNCSPVETNYRLYGADGKKLLPGGMVFKRRKADW